jgi:hypothetical protein
MLDPSLIMDRTQINIISILLGGAGLFIVLTGFNVPEVNMTFFDTNPFVVKRNEIESTMKWVFTGVVLCGFLLRLFAEISDRPKRSHDWRYYSIFCAGCFIAVVMLVWGVTIVGNLIARSHWEPKVIELQRENFERVKSFAEHDGKADDTKAVKRQLSLIEELLEVESHGDLRQRIERLQPIFTKPPSP